MVPERPSGHAPIPLRSLETERVPPEIPTPITLGPFPRPMTSLIGRAADVLAAAELLVEGGVRLLTLSGPGGVGKTRLAVRISEEVAASFPDGVVFVPLAAINEPELVLSTIGRALGLREVGTQPPSDLVADYLKHRRLLLVLDNFEQVRAAATQLAGLLYACPDVVALVTSRVRLHVAGEQRFPVLPLALPDDDGQASRRRDAESLREAIGRSPAVQLFVVRAQAVDPWFALDADNASAIAAICRQLDGLPLAIELTAARVHLLSPPELLAHLSPSLPLLTEGPEDAPDRLRTMRDAIAWSHDLLSSEEQALFRRLAIFVGGFTLEAARSVAGFVSQDVKSEVTGLSAGAGHQIPDTPITLDLFASLVDKSLLQRIEGSGDDTRFGMLETIREFGVERLSASGELAVIAKQHATWCVNLAGEVRRSGRLSQGCGLTNLEAEHPNLRAALSWLLAHGDVTTALHLVGLLAEFWMRHGHWEEGKTWLERTLAADEGEATAARAVALVGLNMMLWPREELAATYQLLHDAESIARAVGDAGALAYARLHQGYVALFQRNFDLAEARGEEALTTAGAIPQEFSLNGARWLLAAVALARREDERAAWLYDRLMESARAGRDEISLANALYGHAVLAERRNEPARALAGFAEAASVCRGFGDHAHASHCLKGVAVAAAELGCVEPAVRLQAAACALRAAMGAAPIAAVDHEPVSAAARAALGEERFAAVWAAGEALSLDEAIAEATDLSQLVTHPSPGRPALPARAAAGLTSREHAVLRLLVDGRSDKEIAATLGIGRRTVSNHVTIIRGKLDAPSRTAAAIIALRDGLV